MELMVHSSHGFAGGNDDVGSAIALAIDLLLRSLNPSG